MKQLVSSEVLAFPDFQAAIDGSRKFQLVTDASKEGFGASLEQKQPDGKIRPLLYISRTTLPSEKNWDTSELECGALVWAIKKLRVFLYGIPFEAYTDHQPLLSFISMSETKPRVHRMCNVLYAYQFSLKYRPGKHNQLDDASSRLPLPATADDYDKCRLIEPGGVELFFCWSE